MITLEWFYALCGALLAVVAWRSLRNRANPRRWTTALFWALLAAIFLAGKALPAVVVGYVLLVMVLLVALGGVRGGPEHPTTREERTQEAERLKNRVFWPALAIPATAVVGSLLLGHISIAGRALVEGRQVALVSLGLGALLALGWACRTTGSRVGVALVQGDRLLQGIGAVLILPQLLAALGGIFAKAGVGAVVAEIVGRALPTHDAAVAVAAYAVGMAAFTMCMGNAFAAFAVITGGIGLPLIVQQHGGNPAIMAALGMLSGYCGTLMTPMAANFNLVPALLLELPDKNAVIKAQIPIGLVLLAANVILMWMCVYRF